MEKMEKIEESEGGGGEEGGTVFLELGEGGGELMLGFGEEIFDRGGGGDGGEGRGVFQGEVEQGCVEGWKMEGGGVVVRRAGGGKRG